jgi:hypothetical protein
MHLGEPDGTAPSADQSGRKKIGEAGIESCLPVLLPAGETGERQSALSSTLRFS